MSSRGSGTSSFALARWLGPASGGWTSSNGISRTGCGASRAACRRRPPPPTPPLFRAAVGNFERDLRTSARLGFTQLIETYPRSQLAPAAYLQLGELLTLDGELSAAVENYLEIPKLYPTAGEVAAALYRAGELCVRLEEYERAREYLERVINTYPDDWFAGQARNKLEEIP